MSLAETVDLFLPDDALDSGYRNRCQDNVKAILFYTGDFKFDQSASESYTTILAVCELAVSVLLLSDSASDGTMSAVASESEVGRELQTRF